MRTIQVGDAYYFNGIKGQPGEPVRPYLFPVCVSADGILTLFSSEKPERPKVMEPEQIVTLPYSEALLMIEQGIWTAHKPT